MNTNDNRAKEPLEARISQECLVIVGPRVRLGIYYYILIGF